PSTAIDLPLKILISEDPQGRVWLSYNTSAYLQQRHNFPAELIKNIAAVETLANKAAQSFHRKQSLHIVEQAHESEIHVQLLMTMKQCQPRIVRHKIHFHFLISANH